MVLYNRLADGHGGRASYELEFPSGGTAVAMGNLIQQSATTDNPTSSLVSKATAGRPMLSTWSTTPWSTFVPQVGSGCVLSLATVN